MAKTTDEKVNGFKNFLHLLEARKVRESQFGFDFYEVPYQDEAFAEAPKLFAISMKAPTAGHLIGVSTEVPEEFRKFWAIHEFLEEDKPDYKERCLDTLKHELALIPRIVEARYIPLRTGFFRGLVDYVKSKPETYSQNQLEQFTLSRDYLNQLEANLKGGLA
jgi:hypothetical protein